MNSQRRKYWNEFRETLNVAPVFPISDWAKLDKHMFDPDETFADEYGSTTRIKQPCFFSGVENTFDAVSKGQSIKKMMRNVDKPYADGYFNSLNIRNYDFFDLITKIRFTHSAK